MCRISFLVRGVFILFLFSFGLVSPAQSGLIDTHPVVIIENRTNELSNDSPFYNLTFPKGWVSFYYQEPNGGLLYWGKCEVGPVEPGSIVSFEIEWPITNIPPSDEDTIYYTTNFCETYYAFPVGTKEVFEEPNPAPLLELGKGKYPLADPRPTPIFGFASSGTLVGRATFFTTGEQCPCDPMALWKNHGQFVRCVAQEADFLVEQGLLTQEEADEVVSSAAQSKVGK